MCLFVVDSISDPDGVEVTAVAVGVTAVAVGVAAVAGDARKVGAMLT